jgi:hypothetical protein
MYFFYNYSLPGLLFSSRFLFRSSHVSSVHSIISYGINFGVLHLIAKSYLKSKKRIIRVIMNSDSKNSCSKFLKKSYILPLYSQYIFSILLFIVKNRPLFNRNSDFHNLKRTCHDLHPPTANLTLFQKRVCYSGVKIYNHLPLTLKQLSYDITKFKTALREFLLANSFYSMEEYFSWK